MENLFWFLTSFVALLFIIGLYALLATRNLLRILIGMEILTKGVTLLLIAAGFLAGRQNAMQPIVITMIVVEVVIIAVAAGIVIASYRNNKTISVRALRNLKG
ncbi:MAG: NADH-quinone oxidoreductase subunit K [Acidobacteriota bacterium]|jgi:NADH:ubiquinone oxidoreductase subunit K|nr:NADH-quinone oxidoreductase subunit K [Acidobacteriota bacterium]